MRRLEPLLIGEAESEDVIEARKADKAHGTDRMLTVVSVTHMKKGSSDVSGEGTSVND
jgi:hypothetical protein